jgi:hypothetical protein
MDYMLCKHKVADFDRWHDVFLAHAEAQREAGLHILHVLRDAADPDMVVMWFRIDDMEKAKAFTSTPEAREAADESGVIGVPEVLYLSG